MLVAPEHALLETASALTKAARRRRIDNEGAAMAIACLPSAALETMPCVHLILRAAEISLATSLGFYDCLFVALAESLSLPLVTSDDRQAGRAGEFVRAVGLRAALESFQPDA